VKLRAFCPLPATRPDEAASAMWSSSKRTARGGAIPATTERVVRSRRLRLRALRQRRYRRQQRAPRQLRAATTGSQSSSRNMTVRKPEAFCPIGLRYWPEGVRVRTAWPRDWQSAAARGSADLVRSHERLYLGRCLLHVDLGRAQGRGDPVRRPDRRNHPYQASSPPPRLTGPHAPAQADRRLPLPA
jgi:hypothetical protein